jgi:GNAT superfamily N-acetyltransferase
MVGPLEPTASPEGETSDFLYRDARPEDKAEVLAFTANTWEFGDYIHVIFDDWLADQQGRFLVVEDRATFRIAAIDKLTMPSPTEAWFEGLRVHPDYRGQGLATQMQRYMINEARRLGARTVRFLTFAANLTVHRKAYRDGFVRKRIVRYWQWTADLPPAPPPQTVFTLRAATRQEAPELFAWWLRSSAHETAGLKHRLWSYSASSAEEWGAVAGKGYLLVPEGTDVASAALPPPTVLLTPDTDETGRPVWGIGVISASADEWHSLAHALIAHASNQGIAKIEGYVQDTVEAYSGLHNAGFTPDPDPQRLYLFELTL